MINDQNQQIKIFFLLVVLSFSFISTSYAEFIGDTSQNPLVPTTSDFSKPAKVIPGESHQNSSETFLAATGGIQKIDFMKEKLAQENQIKKDATYSKEQCEEIPSGSICTSFYIGGGRQIEMMKQEHSEGNKEKGSSWSNERVREWDKEENLIKDETVRIQSEWRHDDEKDYHYIQRYRNGILEHEDFKEKLTNPSDKNHGLIIEYGRL